MSPPIPTPMLQNPMRDLPRDQPWVFDPHRGLDTPFHDLISKFGHHVIMDLDYIVLEPPLKAAVHATRVFQHYSAQVGRDGETRGVMEHFATALRPKADLLDDLGLVPEEAVFHGFRRPQPA